MLERKELEDQLTHSFCIENLDKLVESHSRLAANYVGHGFNLFGKINLLLVAVECARKERKKKHKKLNVNFLPIMQRQSKLKCFNQTAFFALTSGVLLFVPSTCLASGFHCCQHRRA